MRPGSHACSDYESGVLVPTSVTDRVLGRSFLLLSVLQIVDSRPSWILLLVLGELCSTSRIADILIVLVMWVTWLKYTPLCLSTIPSVEVYQLWVVEKIPSHGSPFSLSLS